jgi:PST family polysaccharide transporter
VNAAATEQAQPDGVPDRGRIPARSLTSRALNAAGWSYLAGFVFLLAQIGYTALTARLVGPAAFGGYALAMTVVQLAGLFGAGGLANAVMRTPELTDRGARTALSLAAGSGLLLSAILVALSAPVEDLFHTPGTAQALRLLAAQPPMIAVAGVSYGLLRRGQRYRAASLIDLGSCLAGFALGAVATASGMGVAGLALGQVTRGAVAMAVGLLCARVSLRPAYDKLQAREFSAFSAQVTGQNLGHYAIANLPLWSVARLAGGAATGLFSRAYQVVALPTDQFATGLMRALYPLYREVSTSKERTRRAMTDALVLTSGACGVIFGAFAVFVQPATVLLLGDRWHAAAAITPLLCAFAAANTVYSVLASAAEALRWMRMIWATQLVFLLTMGAALFAASGRLTATAAAMVVAAAASHAFMLVCTSRRGLLHTGEIARAYPVHIALGGVIAILPPLVARLAVGPAVVPDLCVRAAVLASIGLALWVLRDRIPGLRLGMIRLRTVRAGHVPRHRKPAMSS